MARPLRLEFAGALYHVTSRGDRREDIYLDDDDRESFLSVLSDVVERFNWCVHAYCLMDNHYHLLVETPDGNLSKGMRQLNDVYTQRSNRKHERSGHVFQGRYKAIIVQKETYLLELARYIVLNPVRAGMVRKAENWPWSSYRAMVQGEPPVWLETDWVLSAFGKRRSRAIAKYAQFVAEGVNQASPWEMLKNQVFLGEQAFVDRLLRDVQEEADLAEVPSARRRPIPKQLAEYMAGAETRDAGIVAAYASGGYSMKEIGDFVGLHYSRISKIVARSKGKT